MLPFTIQTFGMYVFILGCLTLLCVLYLGYDLYMLTCARPVVVPQQAHGVRVPVAQSPYVVAPIRRTRRRGTAARSRIDDELLWMRRLQRELKFRDVSSFQVRGIAV